MSATCPPDYRYRPEVLRREPDLEGETLYVIGGLYGNPEALQAILDLRAREERAGARVTLVFNGDFHWFDVHPAVHGRIGQAVREHAALRGNVEAELARHAHPVPHGQGTLAALDCGCSYPDYVEEGVVERSNAIFARLAETAAELPELRAHLAGLPLHLVARVGSQRVAILHGDPESLAGWHLAAEALTALDAPDARAPAGCGPAAGLAGGVPQTPRARIEDWFRRAGVDAFATTHTCLPFARDLAVDGRPRMLVNNGSAGMPNFRGLRCGVLTRISSRPGMPAESLYGLALGGVRYDALAIPYDHERWLRRFLADWPVGSPAHASYFQRIAHGPAFTPQQAIHGQVQPGSLRRTA